MKPYLSALFVIISLHSPGQDLAYARGIIDTLCSERYDGRGYYNNGEKRAAEFIKAQYRAIGLQKMGASYFQKFPLSVSAIHGKTLLILDKDTLLPGKDYLIHPSSPTHVSVQKIIYITKDQLTDLVKYKAFIANMNAGFIVIDHTLLSEESMAIRKQAQNIIRFLKFEPSLKLSGVIEIVKEKLTYTATQERAERPHIIIRKEQFSETPKKIEVAIENQYNPTYTSQNVIGYIPGTNQDSVICLTAHYDHLGRMGDAVYFPGANDNASGIAMMLNLAKDFTREKLPYTLVFIAFGSEEIGLEGSHYFTENPLFPLQNIKFLINLDLIGTGDLGIQVVNGTVFHTAFDTLVALNKQEKLLPHIKTRGVACNSDHCFFYEKGVPCFFIYTLGGPAYYHDIYDNAHTLPLTEYEDLFILLKKFIVLTTS